MPPNLPSHTRYTVYYSEYTIPYHSEFTILPDYFTGIFGSLPVEKSTKGCEYLSLVSKNPKSSESRVV